MLIFKINFPLLFPTGWYSFFFFFNIYLFGCAGSQLWYAGSVSCGMWTLSCGMWESSSLTRDQTQTPCVGSVGMQGLSHWTTREVPGWYSLWLTNQYTGFVYLSVSVYIKSLVPENISLTLKIGTDIIKMFSSHASALNSLLGSSHSFSLC